MIVIQDRDDCLTKATELQGGKVQVWGIAMIRATAAIRALVLTAAFAAGLTPVTCLGETSNQLPPRATKELPAELLSLLQKKMPKHSPILVRIFKEQAEAPARHRLASDWYW
jgi:hypothetical protein